MSGIDRYHPRRDLIGIDAHGEGRLFGPRLTTIRDYARDAGLRLRDDSLRIQFALFTIRALRSSDHYRVIGDSGRLIPWPSLEAEEQRAIQALDARLGTDGIEVSQASGCWGVRFFALWGTDLIRTTVRFDETGYLGVGDELIAREVRALVARR